jgi:hypothetical protein
VQGLSASLLQSYSTEPVADPQFFEGCKRGAEFHRLLYGGLHPALLVVGFTVWGVQKGWRPLMVPS